MPRRLLGVFMLLLASVSSMQAQGDVVLFTVGREPVSVGEFEYRRGRSLDKRRDVLLQTSFSFFLSGTKMALVADGRTGGSITATPNFLTINPLHFRDRSARSFVFLL